MRSSLLLSCVMITTACAGCTRDAAAKNEADATVSRPAATPEKPAATVAPPRVETALGEDEDGKVVDAAALDAIKSALKDADAATRRATVRKLGRIRWKYPEPVGGILKQALADTDAETRIEAVHAASADPMRTADIVQLLGDPDRHVQLAAARALIERGKHEADAYPILAAALADRQFRARGAILDVIRTRAPASRPALPVLVALALDAKEPLRLDAIGVLPLLGPAQEAVDGLLLVAHDPDTKVRAVALRSLGRLDPQSAKVQVTLVKALHDPQVDVVLAATEAVGHDAIAVLIERLRHGDERLRDASVHALGRLGPEAWAAVPELTRLAQSDPVQRVRQSAQAARLAIVPAEVR